MGEIVALKWECVDGDFIHVDYSEHRLIPVTKDISELLATIRSHSTDATCVFAGEDGRITETEVSNACRRRSNEVGVKRTSIPVKVP